MQTPSAWSLVLVRLFIAIGAALTAGVFTAELRAPELAPTYRTAPAGFWYVFAVFFPAVTGFTAGIGLSGDLENPRRSIPRGTLLAVMTGALVYLSIPILLSITDRVTPEQLAEPGIIWVKIAVLGAWLVFPGVWGAILSSAFGSALGGPRVLQSLSRDGLTPAFFARTSATGQPTIAAWVSGAIALGAVALGGLNAVAQFVTILFLTLYVTINLSAAAERWALPLEMVEFPWSADHYLESGETLAEGASRELHEEAGVLLPPEQLQLYMTGAITFINQVYVGFRGAVDTDFCHPGPESLGCAFFSREECPWGQLAYPEVNDSIEQAYADLERGEFEIWQAEMTESRYALWPVSQRRR